MHFFALIPLALLASMPKASAQSPPGPINTNPGCGIASDGVTGSTYYYAPGDQQNFNLLYQSTGPCNDGSYAQMEVITPNGIVQCGYAPLDGAVRRAECPLPRGSMQAGGYEFRWYSQPNGGGNYIQITISHTQVTVIAPPPTTTLIITPTSFQTETKTITETNTETSAQTTVTSPSSTATNVIFVTPKPTKITTTEIFTFTRTVKKQTIAETTVTVTAPCRKPTLLPCRKRGGRKRDERAVEQPRKGRFDRRALNARDIAGGPLTTTTTPPAIIVTGTTNAITSTITVTTDAPDATITVPHPTPTLTVFNGVKVVDSTSTLPQKTKTKKRHSWTVTTTTTTNTWTLTRTVKTTPPCAP